MSSRLNKNAGMTYRDGSGALSGFVLDSMRGLLESIRYNSTGKRLEEMDKKTDELNLLQDRLKKIEGHTGAVTDIAIIFFSVAMLLTGIALYQKALSVSTE